jgi:coatomer subunit beta
VLTKLQFPDVADSVIHVLMDFLNGEGAIDVILFVRAISEQYPPLRLSILGKLTSSIRDMTSSPVLCVALWVLGTYIDGADPIAQVCIV